QSLEPVVLTDVVARGRHSHTSPPRMDVETLNAQDTLSSPGTLPAKMSREFDERGAYSDHYTGATPVFLMVRSPIGGERRNGPPERSRTLLTPGGHGPFVRQGLSS